MLIFIYFIIPIIVILEWFVVKDVASYTLSNPKCLIEEDKVETKPELLHEGVLDENVNFYLIRQFFTADAWMCVTNVGNRNRRHMYTLVADIMKIWRVSNL